MRLIPALLIFAAVTAARAPSARAANPDLVTQASLRFGATMEKILVKDVRFTLNPEVRTDGLDPERYLLDVGLKYTPLKYLSLRTGLRGDLDEKKDGLLGGYRYRFDVVGMLPMDDFEPNMRLRFMYDFGPSNNQELALRYAPGLTYSVPKTQLDFSGSVEVFQDLRTGEFMRMRYALGSQYRFYKSKKKEKKLDQSLSLGYMLDYFLTEPLNRHIIEFGYKIVF